ncbi:MAG: hypothetical protein FD160_3254 [Caulobacteraceae bacterium]|nr:MAG: hypothetical protein FD160_3254 [Caulobacteraceae bacterium]TXT37312.1 MAG: hypothetical protein FD138_694 [Planctomycetota bacterium]
MSRLPQLQSNNKTYLGRHWTEHSVLRRYFAGDRNLSILSFGCSTGEELLSLRTLFPSAQLFGCDVDWVNLQAARALLGGDADIFEADERELRARGPVDIIVCNSVLLTPSRTDSGSRKAIEPSLWSDTVALLDSLLKPGGVLQIINSNIPFRYHSAAKLYSPLPSNLIYCPNFVDQFDLDGRLLCTGVGGMGWSSILSRHLAEEGWRELQVGDLQDVHFFKIGGRDQPAPVNDEIYPNLPHNGVWARGTMSYRPEIDVSESRASTYTEVDLDWVTFAVDSIHLERRFRRVWFDGSIVHEGGSIVEFAGPPATAFIEAALGKRSTRLTLDALMSKHPIHSPSF